MILNIVSNVKNVLSPTTSEPPGVVFQNAPPAVQTSRLEPFFFSRQIQRRIRQHVEPAQPIRAGGHGPVLAESASPFAESASPFAQLGPSSSAHAAGRPGQKLRLR